MIQPVHFRHHIRTIFAPWWCDGRRSNQLRQPRASAPLRRLLYQMIKMVIRHSAMAVSSCRGSLLRCMRHDEQLAIGHVIDVLPQPGDRLLK